MQRFRRHWIVYEMLLRNQIAMTTGMTTMIGLCKICTKSPKKLIFQSSSKLLPFANTF